MLIISRRIHNGPPDKGNGDILLNKNFSSGLLRLYLHNSYDFDAVSGKPTLARPRDGNSAYTSRGLLYNNSLDSLSGSTGSSFTELAAASKYTVVSWARPMGGLVLRQALWTITGASSLGVAAGYSTASRVFAYPQGDTQYVVEGVSGFFELNTDIVVGFSFDNNLGSEKAKFYKNGLLAYANNPDNSGNVSSSITTFNPGGHGSTQLLTWRGLLYLTAVWNRVLSSVEHAMIGRNPLVLFGPYHRYIPTSAAAASLPTLSASTYVPGSLTSTGWRPRVTAEYA